MHADREVEPFETERLTGRAFHRMAGGVVALPASRVAERFVGLGDLAELRRGHPVTGVDVRMEAPRQPLVRALDVGQRRAAFHAEDDVEVHAWRNSELLSLVHDFGIDDIALLLAGAATRVIA